MKKIPAYEGREPYIFISYAHKDSEAVLPVVESLYRDKYRVWYDEGIAPGSEWPHYIAVHLENCDTAAVFISENSAESVNCGNEIVRALELGKNIVVCSLDGTEQKRLKDCPHADVSEDVGAIEKLLDDKLIGDGVTGYEREKKRGTGFVALEWSLTIYFLLTVLFLSVYGLADGRFDNYLPGRQKAAKEAEEQLASIDNDLLAEAIFKQIDKEDLMRTVEFKNEESAYSFASAVGTEGDIKKFDLIKDHRESLSLDYADDEIIALLRYFPDLTTVEIHGGEITSLDDLMVCHSLRTVALAKDIFPVKIPEDARFDVTLMQ